MHLDIRDKVRRIVAALGAELTLVPAHSLNQRIAKHVDQAGIAVGVGKDQFNLGHSNLEAEIGHGNLNQIDGVVVRQRLYA